MGPLVCLRGLSARVSFAGAEPQDTPWHQHLRVVPSPLPPWFSRPHAIDCLIYLDDLNDETGALSVVPGSHHWLDREPPPLRYEPLAGEQTLRLPAGSMVIIHSNLWHRALHARRHAPHAHSGVHAGLVARVAARWPAARQGSYP